MTRPNLSISRIEFIAIMAVLTATAAFAIDGMLPALPDIGAALSPNDPINAQLVLSFFIWGLSFGTFVSGPISDAFGRKITAIGGAVLYCLGAYVASTAQTIEIMLAARLIQGVGGAAPRIVAQAIIRDYYSGRDMATMMSYVMVIFALVPSLAPLLGSFVIMGFGWRAVFVSFIVFGFIGSLWLGLRVDEPLPVSRRRPLKLKTFSMALREMFTNPMVRIAIITLVLVYSVLFTTLMLVQPVFDHVFHRNETFAYWFAAVSLCVGLSSLLNSRLVRIFGMRRLPLYAVTIQIAASLTMLGMNTVGYLTGNMGFYLFLGWLVTIFATIGFTIGNLTALAMEPLGHIAGTAASAINAIATFGSVIIATSVGQSYDQTPRPMILGILGMVIGCFILIQRLRRYDRPIAHQDQTFGM